MNRNTSVYLSDRRLRPSVNTICEKYKYDPVVCTPIKCSATTLRGIRDVIIRNIDKEYTHEQIGAMILDGYIILCCDGVVIKSNKRKGE